MSRSYRHTPRFGYSRHAEGDRWWKRLAWSSLRRAVRDCLRRGEWERIPQLREVSEVWDWPKDGKRWWQDAPAREMRK